VDRIKLAVVFHEGAWKMQVGDKFSRRLIRNERLFRLRFGTRTNLAGWVMKLKSR
jgi:hypothetical protein